MKKAGIAVVMFPACQETCCLSMVPQNEEVCRKACPYRFEKDEVSKVDLTKDPGKEVA